MRKIKIAFVGSDGSGKSTIIKYLKQGLEKEGKSVEVFFLGWRSFQNPILRMISKFYMKRKEKKSIKEEKLQRFRPRSWFFYALYYSELWLRYLKIILSKKEYILIDRYFYDELAFAKGMKLKFFKIITPVPNRCFILKASPEILKKRKENISKEMLENFYSHMHKLSESFPMIRLDSSKSLSNLDKEIRQNLRNC